MEKKLSQQMKEDVDKEENDLSYMGKMKKVFRQERVERFEDVLPQLLKSVKVIDITHYEAQGKYMITTDTKFGIVDYYPKANKILIRKDNDWILGGMTWLYKNLIN